MARAKAAKEGTTELHVNYGNVNVGDEVARLSFSVSRGNMTVSQADRLLCCKRITCTLQVTANGDAPGQQTIPGMANPDLKGVADCKRFSAGGKYISSGLTFVLTSVDLGVLAGMAKKSGKLLIESAENIPEEEKGGAEDEDEIEAEE